MALTLGRGVDDKELADLYGAARLLIAAAIHEPFGLTPLEAMATGTPVVAVADGGYVETVRPGVNGALVPRSRRPCHWHRDLARLAAAGSAADPRLRDAVLDLGPSGRRVAPGVPDGRGDAMTATVPVADAAPTDGRSRATIGSAGVMTIAEYAVSMLVAPLVLDRAGVDMFGVWATVASVLAVGALADAGLRIEIGRRVADALGDGDERAMGCAVHHGTTLLAVIAGTLVAVGGVATPWIRGFVFPHGASGLGASELDLLLRLTFLLLGVSLLADGYFAVLRGIQRSDVEYHGRLVGLLAGTMVLLVGLTQGWSVWSLFAGAATQDVVAIGVQALGVRRLLPRLRFRIQAVPAVALRSFVALSGMALVSQLSDVVDSQWDKVMLSRYVGAGAVAGFQIGTTLTLQAKAVALLPVLPLLAAMAELRRGDRGRAERLFHVPRIRDLRARRDHAVHACRLRRSVRPPLARPSNAERGDVGAAVRRCGRLQPPRGATRVPSPRRVAAPAHGVRVAGQHLGERRAELRARRSPSGCAVRSWARSWATRSAPRSSSC